MKICSNLNTFSNTSHLLTICHFNHQIPNTLKNYSTYQWEKRASWHMC